MPMSSRQDNAMPQQYERELYEIAKANPATVGKKSEATSCKDFDGPNAIDGKYNMNGIRDVRGQVRIKPLLIIIKIQAIDCTL